MSDDFFDRIDASLAKQNAKEAARARSADANRAFVKGLIPRLVEIAESYAAKCNERGISASVKHHDCSITFSLRYKDGQERALIGSPQSDMSNKLSFEEHFPNNEGKSYKSIPTEWYDESNWSDDRYEAKLKKMIEDFVSSADKFGGI